MESFFSDPGEIQQFTAQPDFFLRISITFQVMAVTDVSTGHQYAIGSFFESADNEHRIHPSGTHDSDGSQVGRVLQTGNAGQIRAFTGNEYVEDLASGNVVAAMAWSGDVFQLQLDTVSGSMVVS